MEQNFYKPIRFPSRPILKSGETSVVIDNGGHRHVRTMKVLDNEKGIIEIEYRDTTPRNSRYKDLKFSY